MFVHLNIHSVYSAMKGLLSLVDMIALAKSYSMNTLALTDVNGMWGFIRFVQQCHSSDIQPIAGVNLITDKQEVVILVENQHGYENLCRIISHIHDDHTQAISDIIEKYSSGLFILSYDALTLKELKRFIPNTHLFIELRPGMEESVIQKFAKDIKLEIVATGDVYFKSKRDHTSHRILHAIDHNITLEKVDPLGHKSDQHWFRNEEEMVKLFPNSLSALNNSRYLADRHC